MSGLMISRPITFTTTRKLKLGAIGLLISRKVGLCGKKINDDVRADISIAKRVVVIGEKQIIIGNVFYLTYSYFFRSKT